MIHEYKSARSICSFVEFCAWAGVVIAILIALFSLGGAFSHRDGVVALLALAPAFSLLLLSFIVIIIVQMARATMDGSVAAQKAVIQSKKHHEESMKSLRSLASRGSSDEDQHLDAKPSLSSAFEKANAEPAPATTTPLAVENIRYNGKSITVQDGKYRVFGIPHATLDAAKAFVDNAEEPSALPGSNRREPKLTAPKGLA